MPLTKVTSGVIAANAVVDSFGTQSITGDKLGLTAINANNIVNGAITGAKIATGTITGDDIATGQITGNLIATSQITGNLLTANCVSGNNIVASVSLTSPTISGNLNLDSTGTTGVRVPSANTMAFHTTGTENMRITSAGTVGIGTTAPTGILDVANPSAGDCTANIRANTGGAYAAYVNLYGGNQTGSRYSGVYSYYGSTAQWKISGNGSDSTIGFSVGSGLTEAMRITSAGYLLVGKTTSGASVVGLEYEGSGGALLLTRSSNPTVLCNRQGSSGINIQFRFQDADCGSISVNTGSTAYNTSSDYRLKENIAPMTGALDKVAQLKPVTYTWKETGDSGQGFIAHELAEVVPECVTGEKDEVYENGDIKPQGIDTSFLVATLTAAIQEQQAIIEELKTRVAALEAK